MKRTIERQVKSIKASLDQALESSEGMTPVEQMEFIADVLEVEAYRITKQIEAMRIAPGLVD